MSTRWKKVVSIIGISAMLATNSIGVMAEEAVDGNEIKAVETDSGQPEDPSADDQSGNSETGEQSQDTTANDESDNPVTDDKTNSGENSGQPGDSENDDQSGDGEVNDKSEDAAADDKSENEGTDDKAEAEESDGKPEDTENDKSEDGVTADKPEDTTTDDKSEDTTANDKSEDVAAKPEDAITDEKQGDVVTDEGIATLAEPDNSSEGTEAAIPTKLGWSDTKAGYIRFKHNEYVEGDASYSLEYYYELYKDGALQGTWSIGSYGGRGEYCEMGLVSFPQYIFKNHETYYNDTGKLAEEGTYKYRLKVRESNETSEDFSEGKVSEFSSEYYYTKSDEKLPTPQNVHWNSDGVLEWDAVEGVDSYMIELGKGEKRTHSFGLGSAKYDLSQYLTDDNVTYVAVVCAKGEKNGRVLYSDYSSEVTYKVGETNAGDTDSVAAIVDKVNADSTPEAVSSAVTELANQYQGEDKNKLQIAMQTSDETQAQVKKLDDLYAQKANIETKAANIGEGVALDSSKVSMVGAALNASEGASIQMNIRKPEPAKDIISNNKDYWENEYGNAVQFSMDVTGINSSEDLAIPITITMPIPNNLNPERLVILHQQADGDLVRIENKVDKEAGIVRFTITHFSEFIFAETASAGDDDNKPGTGDDDKPGTGDNDDNKPGTGDDDNNKPGTGDDDNKPGTGDDDNNKPGTGDDDNKPGTGDNDDNKPGTGDDDNKPGTGDDDNNKPGTGDDDNKPGTGDDDNNKPGTGDDDNKPGTGDNDDNKPGTGDDDNKPGTGADNNTSSNEGTESQPSTSSSSRSSSSSSSASSSTVTAPKAKVPMIGKSEGWSSLGKEVNEAIARKAEGTDAVVWVKLNDAELVPASALRGIAGKDVTVCFETKTGDIVNVNGRLLTPSAVGEIKIISNKGKDGSTSLKIRNTVPDMNQAIVIFAKAQTGAQEKILYFVDATNQPIPFRTTNVETNGYAAFEVPFVNANYVIK